MIAANLSNRFSRVKILWDILYSSRILFVLYFVQLENKCIYSLVSIYFNICLSVLLLI